MKRIYGAKLIVLPMAMAAIVLFGSSCSLFKSSEEDKTKLEYSSDKTKSEPKNINETPVDKLKETAEKYIDTIVIGLKDRNYKMFSEHLTDEMKTTITKDKFELMVDAFEKEKGVYQSRVYLGELTKGYFKVFFWKGKFVRPDVKSKKDKKDELEDETLIRLILGEVDDKYLIFGFSFQ